MAASNYHVIQRDDAVESGIGHLPERIFAEMRAVGGRVPAPGSAAAIDVLRDYAAREPQVVLPQA